MDTSRSRKLNTYEESLEGNVVLYWMSRDQRVSDNWALSEAQETALRINKPLVVVFTLSKSFLGATLRQYDFMLRGLEQIERNLNQKQISFVLLTGDPVVSIGEYIERVKPCVVYTDFSPLRPHRMWRDAVAKNIQVPFIEIDAHNCIPAWVTSDKKEFAAYTIRPKIYKLIERFKELPKEIKKHPVGLEYEAIDWAGIRSYIDVDTDVAPVSWCTPGEGEAQRALKHFIKSELTRYVIDRNDPTIKGQSNLSPYLHFGQLSAQRVAYEVCEYVGVSLTDLLHERKNGASTEGDTEVSLAQSASAFLEELIVRKELAENFCLYEPLYDSVEAFPDWAQKSIKKTASDKREYIYTEEQFERGETHDYVWNAAQLEMVKTGKMHGYMRMYWAKKILEWTKNAEDAMKIAVYLNDKYELDGRDPNGYAGIAWSIGGVHDRAWFSRPIFGQIRYMNEAGLKRKFNTNQYVENVSAIVNGTLI